MAAVASEAKNDEGEKADEQNSVSKDDDKMLDAGALFVLKSKGSWLHCAYHLTTAVAGPVLLTLPLSLELLGWWGGVGFLVVAAVITFYSYNLLSIVLEHHAQQGNRLLRFKDMTAHVLGPYWGRYYVGPIQVLLCFAVVVAGILLIGITIKILYLIDHPTGKIKLFEFIIFSGILIVVLAQIPSFHSLRYLSLISCILCIAYSACATAGSIYVGHSSKAPARHYSIPGSGNDIFFGIFSAISIIATSFGCGILPEIQATIAPPLKGKMFKGLCLCYAVVLSTFFSVAISGYWAFGNTSLGNILLNFMALDGRVLVPKWFFKMTNIFTILQLFAVIAVYMQPINVQMEQLLSNPKKKQFSQRNIIPRVISRSVVVSAATLFAAMIPFFGDIVAVIGAFVVLPLNFVLPFVMYNVTFQSSPRKIVLLVNWIIAIVFSGLTVLGGIATIRQIALDAKNYKLFANV